MERKFTAFLLLPQLLFIVLFGIFVDYDDSTGAKPSDEEADSTYFDQVYPSKHYCVRLHFTVYS